MKLNLSDRAKFEAEDPKRLYVHRPAIRTALAGFKGRLLEVGCGTGGLAAEFAEGFDKVVAVDRDGTAIDEAKRLYASVPNLSFGQCDVRGYRTNMEHDAAMSSAVLHCVETEQELVGVLKAVHDLLNPGAPFVNVMMHPDVPLDRQFGNRIYRNAGEGKVRIEFPGMGAGGTSKFSPPLSRFTKEQCVEAAMKAGFASTSWQDLFPTQEGIDAKGADYWGDSLTTPSDVLLVLHKGHQ